MSKARSELYETNDTRRVTFVRLSASMFVVMSIMALQPVVAWANSLPTYQINAQAGSAFTGLPDVLVMGCAGGPFCSASVQVFGPTGPTVMVAGDGANFSVDSSAVLTYDIEVMGPAGVVVPLLIDGNDFLNPVNAVVSGGIFFGQDNGRPGPYLARFYCSASTNSSNCPDPPDFHLATQVVSGIAYTIGLSVGGTSSGLGGKYTGSVDPVITIDPAFANAGLFSIQITDGIGIASGAPEPASFLLVGAALLWFGGTALRTFERPRPRASER